MSRRHTEHRHAFLRSVRVAAAVLAVSALAAPGAPGAQETVVIGGSGLPEVEVNIEVLNALGAAPARRPLRSGTERDRGDSRRLLPPPGRGYANQAIRLIPPDKPAPAPPPAIPKAPAPPPQSKAASATVAPLKPPPPAATPVKKPSPPPARAEKPQAPATRVERTSLPEPKVAALPPAPAAETTPAPSDGQPLRIEFGADAAALPPSSEPRLKVLANLLRESDEVRVKVMAFAGAPEGDPSIARRLSLSRALAVRAFLIGEGVRSTRIDVRALGNKSNGGLPDRVDVVVVNR